MPSRCTLPCLTRSCSTHICDLFFTTRALRSDCFAGPPVSSLQVFKSRLVEGGEKQELALSSALCFHMLSTVTFDVDDVDAGRLTFIFLQLRIIYSLSAAPFTDDTLSPHCDLSTPSYSFPLSPPLSPLTVLTVRALSTLSVPL